MNRLVAAGAALLVVVCAAGWPGPRAEDAAAAPRWAVGLRDGSVIVGRPVTEAVPMVTESFGRVHVRADAVDTVEFQTDKETAVVFARGGDVLRGVITGPALVLRTAEGDVSVRLADVRRVAAVTGGPLRAKEGLVAHYPFSGGAEDASGHGNHGKVHGAVLAPDRFGRPNSAYRFDGKDDCIEVPPSPSLGEGESVTVTAWVCRQGDAATQHIVRQGNFEAGRYRYGLLVFSATDPGFNTYDGASWAGAHAGNEVLPDRWCHLAGVYDSAARALRLYVNGVEASHRLNAGINPRGAGEPVMIGAERYHTITSYFDGLIDDVRIYSRALARGEVLDLCLLEREPSAEAVAETAPVREWSPDDRTRISSRVILQRGQPVRTQASIDAEISELRKLHASGAVSREVYEREMRALDVAGSPGGGVIDDFTGRMQVLTRLYHAGEITTDVFLQHHTPVWEAWYRAINILPNGGFEEVENREAPPRLVDLAHWDEAIMGYGDVGHSRMEIDTLVKHGGRQSLKFTSTRGPSLISLYSKPFMVERDDSIKVQFFVKAHELKRGYTGRAGTINFALAGDSLDLRPALRVYIPEGTYDWTMQEARLQIFGNVPPGQAMPCRLAFEFFGEGTLWLDDILVCPTTRRSSRTER